MTQKFTQMRLVRYLFTAVLTLLFINCSKGHSSERSKPNNGEQTTSSKQSEEEIGFGQRELTLQVGETAKVTLHGVRNPRIESSNNNLVEATLIEQGTAVSLKGLQAGEGTIRILSGNRHAELRVIAKANEEDSNNPFNGMSILGDKISYDNYILSADGLTLVKWKNTSTQNLDMNRDPRLRKITFIGNYAFRECRNLKNIRIPSSATRIGRGAFEERSSLKSATIPNSVTSIEEAAFYNCRNLTVVNIPNSVTSIGKSTFAECSSLTSINIPNSVTSIGEWAFSRCSSLKSVTIPRSVTSIREWTFEGCSSLTSVTIPSSVTSIGKYAFSSCSSLTSVTIPSSVTSIGGGAFSGCSSLTSITIPSSVTSIKEWAFSGCSNLTSATIPSSVTRIGKYAFSSCSSLTSVTIPSSVTSIGGGAFSGCSSLTSITIPSSVTSIKEWAFSGCSNLTSVVFKGNNPPKLTDDQVFGGTPSSLTFIVPKGAKSRYIRARYPEDKLIEQ